MLEKEWDQGQCLEEHMNLQGYKRKESHLTLLSAGDDLRNQPANNNVHHPVSHTRSTYKIASCGGPYQMLEQSPWRQDLSVSPNHD